MKYEISPPIQGWDMSYEKFDFSGTAACTNSHFILHPSPNGDAMRTSFFRTGVSGQ